MIMGYYGGLDTAIIMGCSGGTCVAITMGCCGGPLDVIMDWYGGTYVDIGMEDLT
jgi:hypothetical protein